MNPLHSTLESALDGARRRFKWLRFLRYLGIVGLAAVIAVLLAGVLMERGWLTSTSLAIGLFVLIFALVTLALPTLLIVVLATQRGRDWSADRVEDANPSLLDRLHTLVFLGSRSHPVTEDVPESYRRRIERQAVREMTLAVRPFEDEARRTRRLWLACLLLVVLTGLFYDRFEPFAKLRAASIWDGYEDPLTEEALLEAPIEDAAELLADPDDPAWGEVRITEPGRDLKVTKVDVVALQIEAATSHAIRDAAYLTTLTGDEPRVHELPAPEEPRFAVYKPYLYVDELRLSDWDVVTYYARAATTADEYASDVYFLEVRPFREEIEKLMGGGGGANLMNQCSGLIDRQKHILRQTHRFLARNDDDEIVRRQDQEKLAEAEGDLKEAVRHLYAEMAATMENQAIGEVLDHLAAAEVELETARRALVDDPTTAPPPEHSALAELVATRKSLQRAISENPESFDGEPEEDPFPTAELPDQLKQISEFRDEEQAAREALEEILDEERRLGEVVERNPSPGAVAGLAPRQEMISEKLDEFAENHPRLAEGAREETEEAAQALRSARDALGQRDADLAAERVDEAVEALEELREAVEQQTLSRQLRDAYKLKELVDRQAGRMGEIESRPGEHSSGQAGEAAEAAREATRQLKEMMEDSSVGQGFGPQLHEALSDERQDRLEGALDDLEQAGDEASRARAARQARQGLEQVSEAFEESAPQILQEVREGESLEPGDGEALDSAIRQLRAMVGSRGNSRSRESDDARRREALLNLRQSLDEAGEDRQARQLLQEAEETLEGEEEIDLARLHRLLEQLERFRAELGGVEVEKIELDLAHIDPSQLPAEYRERIQNYFRKLSEQ